MSDLDPLGVAAMYSALAKYFRTAATVEESMQRILETVASTISGCDHAGLCLVGNDRIETMAATDGTAEAVDALQYQHSEGPCLDAIRGPEPLVKSVDLARDTRYRFVGPLAAALGARSALAHRLGLGGQVLGALNLYSRSVDAYDERDRRSAAIVAAHAAIALNAVRLELEAHQLRDAVASRDVVGQAKGILMERERITNEEAFAQLRRASQELNVRLRIVAQRLVDTGEWPVTGMSAACETRRRTR